MSNVRWVFLFALVGAVSDALDGWAAKKLNQCTQLGKRFDQWVDWLYGIALMSVILSIEGFKWYNIPLILLIGIYMGMRAMNPRIDTTDAAKKKTVLQFTGGVVILFGGVIENAIFLIAGYLLVWSSLWYMWKSVKDYRLHHVL